MSRKKSNRALCSNATEVNCSIPSPTWSRPTYSSLQPKPTEYDGVRFRSKSEAIFARTLDLHQLHWQYEPPQWRVDDWHPDFLAVSQPVSGHEISVFLIEYKPSPVTPTYLEILNRRFARLGIRDGLLGLMIVADPFCAESAREMWVYDHATGRGLIKLRLPFAFTQIDAARSYRFDLAKPR